MHKVFISHHHKLDWYYKEYLACFGQDNEVFLDRSVDTNSVADDLTLRMNAPGRLSATSIFRIRR